MVSLLQHFYDYKESILADRNIGLRDLYIDPNAANIAALKDLFVIHTHVVSACCDLDRRTRASGKSCTKSSPHTCMNIPFSFLPIFLEIPLLMHEKEARKNYILVKQEQSRVEPDLLYTDSMQSLESKG